MWATRERLPATGMAVNGNPLDSLSGTRLTGRHGEASGRPRRRAHAYALRLTAFAFLVALASVLQTHTASTQAAPERVRIPTSFANVHMGPSTGQQVLVLVPRGTVLEVIGRDKEWVQVQPLRRAVHRGG